MGRVHWFGSTLHAWLVLNEGIAWGAHWHWRRHGVLMDLWFGLRLVWPSDSGIIIVHQQNWVEDEVKVLAEDVVKVTIKHCLLRGNVVTEIA